MTGVVPSIASIVVKVTIVTLLALAGARLARRSRASVRHIMLTVAFATLLLVPLVSIVAPRIDVVIPVTVASDTGQRGMSVFADAEPPPAALGRDEAIVRAAPPAPWPSWPLLATGVWALGTALFMLPVIAGLWQVRALRRSALPSRRARAVAGMLARSGRPIDVLHHDAVPGPMTCGIVRPAIVLPVEAQHWSDEDLRRALVHELEHVRRADWLTQCAARVVCAAYWFHPLVWIARRELSLEAERACDDAVLRSDAIAEDADATAYADQLVLLAERLSAVPHPPALAMASRTDLAARVRAVLDSRQRRGRAGARWVALASAMTVLLVMATASLHIVAAPQTAAQASAETRKFDVVSIRPCESEPPTPPGQRSSQGGFPSASPGRFTIECGTVERLIGTAYVRYGEPLTNQAPRIGDVEWLKGLPGWVRTDKFTIEAKAEGTPDQTVTMGPMLRALLEDRFRLKLHRATDEVPMYEMTVAKGGLKIKPDTCNERDAPAQAGPPAAETIAALRAGGRPTCGGMTMLNNEGRRLWIVGGATLSNFAGTLSTFMDHHVIDKTSVPDTFNLRLEFALDEHVPGPDKRYGPPTSFPEVDGPNIFKALEQQIGVTLTATKGPHGFLVIDHVERPSPNSGPRLLPPPAR